MHSLILYELWAYTIMVLESSQSSSMEYSASHSRVAPEKVSLQKEQKYSTFACHTCNEVRLCFGN
jgi:hypothetical protein